MEAAPVGGGLAFVRKDSFELKRYPLNPCCGNRGTTPVIHRLCYSPGKVPRFFRTFPWNIHAIPHWSG